MSTIPVSFQAESQSEASEALERVAEAFPGRLKSHPDQRNTYLDTFDWRIYRDGGCLLSSKDGRAAVLRWNGLDGTSRLRLRVAATPEFVWDLPAGPFRTALEPLVEMRRLMPRLAITSRGETLDVLDADRKTVARVHLESASAFAPQSTAPEAALPVLVVAEPIRGYDKHFQALLAHLQHDVGLQATTCSQLDSALLLLGQNPTATPTKLQVQLSADMPSAAATRRIHQTLLTTIRLNEPGVRQDLDTEFLHDFRVAVRRTRSALTQIKDVYPPDVVDHFKAEFAWLGQITGPTRDLDVYLLKMPDYRASLPEKVQAHLEPLHEYLSRHQGLEQQRLVQGLDSQRYARLLESWQRFLDDADTWESPDEASSPAANVPIEQTASTRIWKAYRKVLKRGRAIGDDSPGASLHQLRIDCKKLRYLLEFFRSLYDESGIGTLVKALKRLQDNLGDFNDLQIQQARLRRFADDMFQEGLATGETLMAMGRLVDRLEARQAEERRKFQQEFSKFASQKNRCRFRELFHPSTTVAS